MFYSDQVRTMIGEYIKAVRRLPKGWASENHVVFVGGVQRSGTNMVMEILESSPDTKVFHERDRRVFDKMFCHRSDEIIKRQSSSIFPCVVFKALSESHKIAELMRYFENSSAVWVYRDYEQVVASNAVRFPGNNRLDAIVVDRSAGHWRARGMTDETLETIRSYYRPDISVASAQALFWYYRNQLFFDQNFERDPRVLVIRYDRIARNTQFELERLAKFLEIDIPAHTTAHVSQSSAARKPHLDIEAPIRALCEGMMKRLDGVLEGQTIAAY